MNEQGKDGLSEGLQLHEGGLRLHPKVMQVVESRKVWAGVIGLVITLALWWLGEIDGARAVEALTWVLGIFIGSVAFEDGMTRFFSSLAHAVTTPKADGAALNGSGDGNEKVNENGKEQREGDDPNKTKKSAAREWTAAGDDVA